MDDIKRIKDAVAELKQSNKEASDRIKDAVNNVNRHRQESRDEQNHHRQ